MKHKDILRNNIWRSFKQGGTQKLVLLFLADREAGGQCVATVSDIAMACGVAERQAQYVLKSLVESGHLIIVGNPNGGCSLPRIYKVCVNPKRVHSTAPPKGCTIQHHLGVHSTAPAIYMFTKGVHRPEKAPIQEGQICSSRDDQNIHPLVREGVAA